MTSPANAAAGSALPAQPPCGLPLHHHAVQFYEDEGFLARTVVDFLRDGFSAGAPGVVIATPEHRAAFAGELARRGNDVPHLQRTRQLVLLDAREVLAEFMVGSVPDPERFRRSLEAVLEGAGISAGTRFWAYGEMVDLLWRDGECEAAISLEKLWNDFSALRPLALLCAYSLQNFHLAAHGSKFQEICSTHTHVAPAETFPTHAALEPRQREIALLQQRARALEAELERSRALELQLLECLAERDRHARALDASRRELSDFVENALEGLHWVGSDGVILWANGAEMQLLGYTEQEYIGRHISEFHADREVLDTLLARLSRGEEIKDYEARLRCKDGSIRHVLIHSNVLFRDGEFVHTRCFTRDITDRKRLETELLRQNEDLSRIVKFSEMFAGILGHDLRNPLSAISTNASGLLRRNPDPAVVASTRRILNSASRMGRMVDQLLDFTRVRLGAGLPVDCRITDLGEVCRTAIEELQAADGTRVRLEVTGDPCGEWDEDRLLQVASNLVSNALHYGVPDLPVTVQVNGTSAHAVELVVHNGGTVPEAVLPVLFEPLKLGANRRPASSSGLGLGLYITREIVAAHGGAVIVSSTDEAGTTFRVQLPRQGVQRG